MYSSSVTDYSHNQHRKHLQLQCKDNKRYTLSPWESRLSGDWCNKLCIPPSLRTLCHTFYMYFVLAVGSCFLFLAPGGTRRLSIEMVESNLIANPTRGLSVGVVRTKSVIIASFFSQVYTYHQSQEAALRYALRHNATLPERYVVHRGMDASERPRMRGGHGRAVPAGQAWRASRRRDQRRVRRAAW